MDEAYERTILFDFYGELLTDKQKEVMILYYREGYTQAEIAEMLGLGRRTVSDRIEAALKKIRKEVKPCDVIW